MTTEADFEQAKERVRLAEERLETAREELA